jgi:holo-[acyl-carrier protein] synthase
MNVIGIGIDSVDVERFTKAAKTRGVQFLKKIFTARELEYAGTKKDNFTHMAGKFAAKEAVKKAIPDGAEIGLRWPDIEILNSSDGKPYAELHGAAKKLKEKFKIADVLVSISHTHKVAVSNAVVMKND